MSIELSQFNLRSFTKFFLAVTAYESSTTNVRTADNEMSRGWSEGAKGVDDSLGVIKEESVENPATSNTEGETNIGIEQS